MAGIIENKLTREKLQHLEV